MVLRAPFVRWARIKNPSPTSPRAALFYLQTAEGSKVSYALAIRGPTNRITYTAFGAFLDEYRQILPMGAVAQWRFSSMFAQWLDGLLYHSFLLCSEEGVSDAWHLDYVASASSCQKFEVRLREAFREFDLEEMVIRMGDCVWNIPINDLQLDVQMFARFFAALDLNYLDFLLVLMLSTMEFRVVVFPLDSDIDRIYSWF